MSSGALRCTLNNPKALQGDGLHSLPPYHQKQAFLVDKFPACPQNWVRSEGNLKSYFVPVTEGHGMWLDFNHTLQSNPYDVALVVSVQGINAITGLPCSDTHLEQYVESCPKHGTKFGPDRFCAKCNYKWPKQNYLCSTGQPLGQLWIDGFRAADGVIRQYVLTLDKMRGVANAIVGENRVFAIGVSCFLSKQQRPRPTHKHRGAVYAPYVVSYKGSGDLGWDAESPISSDSLDKGMQLYSGGVVKCSNHTATSSDLLSFTSPGGCLGAPKGRSIIEVASVEVAAGSKIDQKFYDDPNGLDFWQDSPDSVLVINYALEADVGRILAGGEVNLEGSPEGFLQGLPVGN